MIKTKIVSILLGMAFVVPLLAVSSAANACHRCHYASYYSNYYSSCDGYGYGCMTDRCSGYKNYHLKNKALVHRVVKRLKANATTYDLPIYVTAIGHRVTLSGYTGTAMQKQTAIAITRYTCGVGLVIDNLRMQQP